MLCLFTFVQRLADLEEENALLKHDKEEMNQRILSQSKDSEGKTQGNVFFFVVNKKPDGISPSALWWTLLPRDPWKQ